MTLTTIYRIIQLEMFCNNQENTRNTQLDFVPNLSFYVSKHFCLSKTLLDYGWPVSFLVLKILVTKVI